jgi:hypothetical protein
MFAALSAAVMAACFVLKKEREQRKFLTGEKKNLCHFICEAGHSELVQTPYQSSCKKNIGVRKKI